MYHLLGPEPIPTYNIAAKVFPPDKPYPYGDTVRSYSGSGSSKVEDFPEGTTFHPDVPKYQTWSANAQVAEELLSRAAEFPKLWNRPAQKALQDFTGNGLFTSSETSEDWQSGHSVLPRGFNQIKVKSFAPQILSKTRAFIREWSHFQAGHKVENVNDWLTSMTADAVVACSMGLDMRNVERLGANQPVHAFIENFRFGLGFSGGSINAKTEYGLKRFLPFFGAKAKLSQRYDKCKEDLHKLVDELVESTRAGELGGRDSVIRAMLDDRAGSGKHVRYNVLYAHVINLMIAGHETTAATLGFTLQLLAENPECEAKALHEVRTVLQGRTEPEADDVPKLVYVEQCFREALRLYSPVTMVQRDAAHDTLIGGYCVFQGERVSLVNRALHTNPEYWGGKFGHPLTYNPDRFAPDAVKARPQTAYIPWGFGPRTCIGSQFALFEAKTFLASMLLHFKLCPVPGYKLEASLHAGGAAPSPTDLALFVYPRPGGPLCGDGGVMRTLAPLAPSPIAKEVATNGAAKGPAAPSPKAGGPPLKVLFGSNSGASQEFANQVKAAAKKTGFSATMASMDAAVKGSEMSCDGCIFIIVCSTYNGNPPDNAVGFKTWLSQQKESSLKGLRYAVFGVGNSQWHTYQQFPREVDAGLHACGAERVFDLGACDVDGSSFDSDFDDWLASLLRAVGGSSHEGDAHDDLDAAQEFVPEAPGDSTDGLEFITDIEMGMDVLQRQKVAAAAALGIKGTGRLRGLKVAEDPRELCQKADTGRSVCHVTLRLSADAADYRAGDHLQVLAPNGPELVDMAMEAFGFTKETVLRWDPAKISRQHRNLEPGNDGELRAKMNKMRVLAHLILEWIPDLAAPPSRKLISQLARFATEDAAKEELKALATDAQKHKEAVEATGLSMAEMLLRYKGRLNISIGNFCSIAKPLAPRFYSVSSSPAGAADPSLVTVSVGHVAFKTGTGRVHQGLASTRLGQLRKGGVIPGLVRQLAGNFHLPKDPLTPIIMVGPGTGIAPMMGFLQEREHLLKKKTRLGPAMLFFGCRNRSEDYLYKDELAGHLASGALGELLVAASREGPEKVYVQDMIWEHRLAVWKLLQNPAAIIYVCGDARAMAPDVRRAFQRVAEQCGGRSNEGAANMVAAMVETGRYLEDVWAG